MHINHQRGENRRKAMGYPYTEAVYNRVRQDARNATQRREAREIRLAVLSGRYARNHAFVGELRIGAVPVEMEIPELGFSVEIGEVVLTEQIFVIDGETKVGKVVEQAAADIGAPVKIAGFVSFVLGEGVEKEETDFAAEVAAQVGG